MSTNRRVDNPNFEALVNDLLREAKEKYASQGTTLTDTTKPKLDMAVDRGFQADIGHKLDE